MLPAERAFSARGLDWELADKLGATYEPGKFSFEYRKDGKLLFRKLRTDDKKFWIEPSGAPLRFWGLDEVPVLPRRPVEPLVITEGEFDRIAVLQACGGYALSVPNGTSAQRTRGAKLVAEDTGFSYLWGKDEKLIPEVDQFDRILILTDGDEPGTILRDELAMRIGESRCWHFPYPEGVKDANDILARWGEDGVRRMLAVVRPMRPGHLVAPSAVPPRRHEKIYETGWPWLDERLKLIRSELVVVTGIPGHGKSMWVRSLCCNLAHRHGMKIALLTPEDPPHRVHRDLYRFAVHKLAGVHYDTDAAKAWLDRHFRFSLPPEDEDITLAYLESEMAAAALHHDCQVFVADPFNEISHEMNGLTETQYIERTLMRLKRVARRYSLILIIVAHPRKIAQGDEPDLYSINGSANWKNKCDHGIIINRIPVNTADEGEDEVWELSSVAHVIVEKSKDHETLGLPGRVSAKFDPMRFDYVSVETKIVTPDQPPARSMEMLADDGIPF